jgi:hypothetical protein
MNTSKLGHNYGPKGIQAARWRHGDRSFRILFARQLPVIRAFPGRILSALSGVRDPSPPIHFFHPLFPKFPSLCHRLRHTLHRQYDIRANTSATPTVIQATRHWADVLPCSVHEPPVLRGAASMWERRTILSWSSILRCHAPNGERVETRLRACERWQVEVATAWQSRRRMSKPAFLGAQAYDSTLHWDY